MFLSRYTSLYKSDANNFEYVFINSITQNIVSFSLHPDAQYDIATLSYLKEHLHIFDHSDDDKKFFSYFLNTAKYKGNTLFLTLTTSYLCNFCCQYCYEKNLKIDGKLSPSMNKHICNWIVMYLAANPTIEKIDICFHGGEPLLCYNEIVDFATMVKSLVPNTHQIQMSMVTNGSLLTAEICNQLESIGIRKIQITLDGLKKTHDLRRPYKNGEGSFDDIISGCLILLNTTSSIELTINSVIDSNNIKDVDEFKLFMSERFNNDKRLTYYLSKMVASNGEKQLEPHEQEILNSRNRGVFTNDFKYNLCTARNEHSYVIDHRGSIYKCITGAGNDGFKIGSVFDHLLKIQIQQARFVENTLADTTCYDCSYYPRCLHGCLYNYLKNGIKDACRKNEFADEDSMYISELLKDFKTKWVLISKQADRDKFFTMFTDRIIQ